jgi:hypothetical protein
MRRQSENEPTIRLYVELKEEKEENEVENLIHGELSAINQDYNDMVSILGIRPLRVTLLPAGTFQKYYEEKKRGGADLAHLKPPHMNASDAAIISLKIPANSPRREL